MTDEQIIKALEHNASKCKFYEGGYDGGLFESTLNLINRQKARIKELEEKHAKDERVLNDRVQESVNAVSKADQKYICALERSIAAKDVKRERLLQKLQQAQSEAIKEFAERLKRKIWHSGWCNFEMTITPEIITNLVKEMTEVQK